MSNDLALVMLKCTLIRDCCNYNLMIHLLLSCVELYDMHVELTRLGVVPFVMCMTIT